LLSATLTQGYADDLADSLRKIPETANAVAVINVDALYKSPRSLREGWAKKQEIADSVHMPNSISLLVLGYHIDQGSADDSWRIGVASLKKPIPMETIALKEKGQVETVAGQPAVLAPRNCYFVGMGPTTVAVTYPANRQRTARWLHFAKSSSKPALSSYLQEAVNSDRLSHIIIAFDMQEIVDPQRGLAWLKSTKTVANQSPSSINDIHKLLVQLRGIRISVRVFDQSIVTKVHLDFAESPKEYSKVFKSLFADGLEDFGMALDDVRNCQVQVSGNTVTLQTNLSDDSLARVMSLLLIPHSDTDPEEGAGVAEDPALVASRRYYRAVKQSIEDLKKKYKTANDYYATATWHGSYAKKIDQLPTRNVDKELVQFGAGVAGTLRALASSLRGVPNNVNVLESQKAFQYYQPPVTPIWMGMGGPRSWGVSVPPVQYQDNFDEIRARQMEVIQQGAAEREKLWQAIDGELPVIRQKLTEKFKVDFDEPAKR
jgi:hypothetical protein